MNFCETCGNMVYINIRPSETGGAPQLTCVCKSCGSSSEMEKDKCSTAMFASDYGDDQMAYKQYMTPYIMYDPTLPHATHIECINPNCSRKPEEPRDVVFIKYNRENLKYLYHCMHCKEFWKSSG